MYLYEIENYFKTEESFIATVKKGPNREDWDEVIAVIVYLCNAARTGGLLATRDDLFPHVNDRDLSALFWLVGNGTDTDKLQDFMDLLTQLRIHQTDHYLELIKKGMAGFYHPEYSLAADNPSSPALGQQDMDWMNRLLKEKNIVCDLLTNQKPSKSETGHWIAGLNERNCQETLLNTFQQLYHYSEENGMLSLENLPLELLDQWLGKVMVIYIDGSDAELAQELTANLAAHELWKIKTFMNIICRGGKYLQSGENPSLAAELLYSIPGKILHRSPNE